VRSQLGCAADLPMGLPDNVRPRAPFAAAALVGSPALPAGIGMRAPAVA